MPTNIIIFLLILHKDLQLYLPFSLLMEEEGEGGGEGEIYLHHLQYVIFFKNALYKYLTC
jgi:hypothetical protein